MLQMKPEEIFRVVQNLNKGDFINIEIGEGYNDTGLFNSFENNVISYHHISSSNPIDTSFDNQLKEINIGRVLKIQLLFPIN